MRRRLVRIAGAGRQLPERATDGVAPLPHQHDAVRVVDRHDGDGAGMRDHLAVRGRPVDQANVVLVDRQQAAAVDRPPRGRGLAEVLRRPELAGAHVNAHELSLTPLAAIQAQDHSWD